MFRSIYYISGIIIALLNSRRLQNYDRWLDDIKLVKRDTIVVITLIFVVTMLSLFTWYWLPITVVAIVLLNAVVYFGVKLWNWIIRRILVKR